jgi:hypothetical protein
VQSIFRSGGHVVGCTRLGLEFFRHHADVRELGLSVDEYDIGRLDVTMGEIRAMQVRQSAEQAQGHFDRRVGRDAAVVKQLPEGQRAVVRGNHVVDRFHRRLIVRKFHDVVEQGAMHADVVDLDQVGVPRDIAAVRFECGQFTASATGSANGSQVDDLDRSMQADAVSYGPHRSVRPFSAQADTLVVGDFPRREVRVDRIINGRVRVGYGIRGDAGGKIGGFHGRADDPGPEIAATE